jgi:hemolysin-activating ACP:hemolysin acyltransferase
MPVKDVKRSILPVLKKQNYVLKKDSAPNHPTQTTRVLKQHAQISE